MIQTSRPMTEGGIGESRQHLPAMSSTHDLVHYLKQYAQQNPSSAALWCFGVGFVVGWKMKIW